MAVAQYEKERMERKGYRGETVKCTFKNGVVLTIVYSLERSGDNQ